MAEIGGEKLQVLNIQKNLKILNTEYSEKFENQSKSKETLEYSEKFGFNHF